MPIDVNRRQQMTRAKAPSWSAGSLHSRWKKTNLSCLHLQLSLRPRSLIIIYSLRRSSTWNV